MTERITPTDVRELASEVIEAMDGHAMSTANQRLIRLAEQMEVDDSERERITLQNQSWSVLVKLNQDLALSAIKERDTLAAKVAVLTKLVEAVAVGRCEVYALDVDGRNWFDVRDEVMG
jgi:phage shock protein A